MIDEAIEDYKDGRLVRDILHDYEISGTQFYRTLKNRGISLRGQGQGMDLEDRNDRIVEAYQDGQTMRAIGEQEGISHERVRQILQDREVETRSPGHSHGPGLSRDEICENIRQFVNQKGFIPTVEQWDGEPSMFYIKKEFGGWTDALWEAGFVPEAREYSTGFTQEEVLNAMRRVFEQSSDDPLSMQRYDEQRGPDDPHSRTITNHFDTWRNALQELGYDVNTRSQYGPDRTWTEEKMLRKMADVMEEKGGKPTVQEWDEQYTPPSSILYQKRFGSWLDAVHQAREVMKDAE